MVHLEDITATVEKDLDDFYKDRDRFKGLKLLVGFEANDYNLEAPELEVGKAKFKKKLKTSTFVKGKKGSSLF
jgi:hypothetical protein